MKDNREKIVIKTSIISIISNILLAGFKAFIGLLANSIAIISDEVNNLSDALSSIITIVGTKLAGNITLSKIYKKKTFLMIFGVFCTFLLAFYIKDVRSSF